MSRFDWDRLRRVRPLDGADPRVDADGAVVWERPPGEETPRLGARRLRDGVVVRKGRAQRAPETDAETTPCPRCGAEVARGRLGLHVFRRCRSD